MRVSEPLSLTQSILRGMIGFTIVSVAGFCPWAVCSRFFHRIGGEIAMYAACLIVFLVFSGLLLHRLVWGPNSLLRFYKVFIPAFTLYAIAWTAAWIGLRGREHLASAVGLFSGALLMGLVFKLMFRGRGVLIDVVLVLFATNALGYFPGYRVEAYFNNPQVLGMLLWGVCYGLGFGAGIGYAFWRCQSAAAGRAHVSAAA